MMEIFLQHWELRALLALNSDLGYRYNSIVDTVVAFVIPFE
jgi:hypothetical protein